MTTAAPNEASGLGALARRPALRRARLAALPAFRATYGTPRPVLPVREDLPFLLNRRGLYGCGVEVGVKTGWFSEVLLDRWKGRHLISVDPWLADDPDAYVDVANVEQPEHERFYEETRSRLERFGERSSIWRMTSDEAAPKVPHHSLDFVYLDARHDYASVLEDLDAWFDRVRPGGVLAGHDYVDGLFAEGDFGVRSAVGEFFAQRDLRVSATFGDPPWISWYVVLPRRA